jgi:5-methylcytosine-specific restriction protein A
MRFEIDFLESHDTASVVAELQRIADLLGKRTVTAKEIDRHGRLNSRTVMQKFGTMRKAHEAAGLIASRYTMATDEELFKVVAELWTKTLRDSGRRPRTSEVSKYGCPVSSRTIVERFGSWKRALIATANAVEMPDFEKPVKPVKVVKTRRPLSVQKRYYILKRDRYKCRICRKSGVELEVDHVIPVSLGGRDTLTNLQTLCKVCNRKKGGKMQ